VSDRAVLGWGVIGAGKLADLFIGPAIARHAESRLAAVCSRDAGRAQAFAQRHGDGSAYDDYDRMLADPAVDIVYVATPNGLHREHAVAALEAGKHVLVEKPMALSIEDGRAMLDAASTAGRELGVGFHLRHKTANQAARAALVEGRLGRVFFADISVGAGKGVYPYDTWRAEPSMAGGGTLLHQGAHAIDLLPFLTGSRIASVACLTDDDTAEDVFAATCELEDGTLATISSHQLHAGTRPDWAVLGERAWLEGRGTTSPFPGDQVVLHQGGAAEPLASTAVSPYDAEIAAFAAAAQGRARVEGSGEDGLRAIAVAEALYRSAREGRTTRVEALDS
jgi:1,5-anhydro-D-fructose reductase (1,5-anhydro-D-mannitol-forming)